jgi:hypothetical protein
MPDTTLIARLSSADTDEFVDLMAQPSLAQEELLRAYLGAQRFRRLRSLALRKQTIRRELGDESDGNVIIVPGLLPNELSTERGGVREQIWLSARSIASGYLSRLRLADSGLADADPNFPLRVTGLMKRHYGELILTLAQRWNVRLFSYDWRKSLALAATQLQARIDECFPAGEQVHIVASGEGGIIARLYIARHGSHWEERRGRLITLGTPHTGSVTFVQALAGHLDISRWVTLLDPLNDWQDFLAIVRSFPSVYQLLPFAGSQPQALYDASTYGGTAVVRQDHLDNACVIQQSLASIVDPHRMIAIVGYNRPTFCGVNVSRFKKAMRNPIDARISVEKMRDFYEVGDGDGTVPRASAELKTPDGQPIPTYYIDVSRDELLAAPTLLRSLDDLLTVPLQGDAWQPVGRKLGLRLAANALSSLSQASLADASTQLEVEWQETRQKLEGAARSVRRARSTAARLDTAEAERTIEDIVMRHLSARSLVGRQTAQSLVPFDPPQIALAVAHGDITNLGAIPLSGDRVDALAVGYYAGGMPHGALHKLDTILGPLFCPPNGSLTTGEPPESGTLFAQLIQRGVIRGDLASIFLLPDPRPAGEGVPGVIAIAGMGLPGRFGLPELTILARELCWTMGRLGKRHLATVLIGAGDSNIGIAEAVHAWVRGIKAAITGASGPNDMAVQQITFVEVDARKIPAMDRALAHIAQEMCQRKRMCINYTPFTPQELDQVHAAAQQQVDAEVRRLVNQLARPHTDEREEEPPPARITVELDNATYRFGAITAEASVPERNIPLDPRLVASANDELAAPSDLVEQQRQGEFMARLLFPADFRADLSGGAPVMLTVDATTARIHWELLALPEQQLFMSDVDFAPRWPGQFDDRENDRFLGIAFGLTRQLRSSFAQRSEPLPARHRQLRVLVVADPAADARLPGAEEEGNAVADLLELYNLITPTRNRVEVVRLIGPAEATRTRVLQHLLTRQYDVLHFAGHCLYNEKNPTSSGWVFTNNELLTANEILRIDRVPALVVSNACESGVTPERAGDRSAGLAPSFAETFFARGVANFVCTAWPVGDREARDFALALYTELLGLEFKPPQAGPALRIESRNYTPGAPRPLYRAMRNARRAIANLPYDRHSWGAYQHYGNPYTRLFQRPTSDDNGGSGQQSSLPDPDEKATA